MVPDTDAAIVQTGQHPWLSRVKVYAFDTVRSSRELAFDVQPERLEEKKQKKITLHETISTVSPIFRFKI